MKYCRDEFLVQAKIVHGDKYDYSNMNYIDEVTPITIICPEHGSFGKRPLYHLKGRGCPKCARKKGLEKRKQTNLERYGATSFAGSKAAHDLYESGSGPWAKASREKAANTCMEKFGAKTWAESDIGIEEARARCDNESVRKEMSERAKSNIARQHYAETSKRNCGAEHWTKTDAGREKLHSMFSTDEERKARSERMLSEEVQEKIRTTSMERYGTPYYWQSDEGRKRLKQLLNNEDVQQKIISTKKSRGTLNSSKAEKIAYSLLVDKFGEDDVETQYKTDSRYPYACDFYIKSKDLFIELNASWLHCFHWFDENDEHDQARLQELFDKSQEGKPMYQRAIYIWTYDDLRKRETAMKNNLNYLVFWDNDLTDLKEWLESF